MTNPETGESGRRAVSVVLPAYREAASVGNVARAMREALESAGWNVEVVVVDDGSTDATTAAAQDAAARVVRHAARRGYGAAVKTGLREAAHEIVLLADADGTYPAADAPRLVDALASCDMAVGARTAPGARIPAIRRPAKWLIGILANYLAEQRIPDLNSGMRAFRRADAQRFARLYPNGFSFTTTITLAFLCSDLRVEYLPIGYAVRVGQSKFRPITDTKNLLVTMVRSILYFNPLRVCVPLGLACFILAAWVLFVPRDALGNIYDGTVSVLIACGLQALIVGFLADMLSRMR